MAVSELENIKSDFLKLFFNKMRQNWGFKRGKLLHLEKNIFVFRVVKRVIFTKVGL